MVWSMFITVVALVDSTNSTREVKQSIHLMRVATTISIAVEVVENNLVEEVEATETTSGPRTLSWKTINWLKSKSNLMREALAITTVDTAERVPAIKELNTARITETQIIKVP